MFIELQEPTQLPAAPTSHRPGSPQKIEIFRQRLEQGVSLYHPNDDMNIMPDSWHRFGPRRLRDSVTD